MPTTKPKVFVLGNIPDTALKKLQDFAALDYIGQDISLPEPELIQHLKEADAFVCTLVPEISSKLIAACPKLKLIANVAVGFDRIDIDAATKSGVLVTNTPGVLDNACADFAFGLLIAAARRIAEADRYVRNGQFNGWKMDLLLGFDISEKTIGIIGFGRIGQAVARRASGFGMKILYTAGKSNNPAVQSFANELSAKKVSLNNLLQESDFISIHCPLTKDTFHLLGKQEFLLLKPNCILINTARGAICDQKAMIQALENRQIAACGLDVFEDEPEVPEALLTMNNVVLAPHIGSATATTRLKMATMAVESVVQAFSGVCPKNTVNPQAWTAFQSNSQLKSAT